MAAAKKKNKNKKRGRRWTRRSRRSWSGRNSPRQRSQSRSMHLCQRCNASKSRVFIFQHTWHTVFAPVWVVWACSDARNAITFAFIKRWLLLHRRLDGKVRDGMLWDTMVWDAMGTLARSRTRIAAKSATVAAQKADVVSLCWAGQAQMDTQKRN